MRDRDGHGGEGIPMGLGTVMRRCCNFQAFLYGAGVLAVGLMMAWVLGACGGEPGYVSISAGNGHTCGVREDGTVDCWGFDEYGQATPPEGEFVSVSAGDLHTCGVRDDGSVDCWGLDLYGETVPPEGKFASVSAKGSPHLRGEEGWGGLLLGLGRIRGNGTAGGGVRFREHRTEPCVWGGAGWGGHLLGE